MSYLGIDVARARHLSTTLRFSAAKVDPLVALIDEAQVLADLPVPAAPVLDQIAQDLTTSAAMIDVAVARLVSYQLRLPLWSTSLTQFGSTATPNVEDLSPGPSRTPVPTTSPMLGPSGPTRPSAPALPLWDARRNSPWNLVHQEASHNSYEVSGGMADLYLNGVRTFELDIHRGAPTDFTPVPNPIPGVQLGQILWDHFDRNGGRDDDWRVYHFSASPHSEYEYLSDGLAELASFQSDDVLTVFIDNKDGFGGTHTGAALDDLVLSQLGDQVYRPSELLARAPGATTLNEAVAQAGWPTVEELDGRIIVVLTDQVEDYDLEQGALFIAPKPQVSGSASGGLEHEPDANVVFYNLEYGRTSEAELRAVQATGGMVRTYFNPLCGPGTLEELQDSGLISDANFRAVDLDFAHTQCADPVPAPPNGSPVPITTPNPSG